MNQTKHSLQVVAATDYRDDTWSTFLKQVAGQQYPIDQELKHDGTTTVVLVTFQSERFVVKRYNTKNKWHFVRRFFQKSRASNCFNMAHKYARADIRTPEPIAYVQERFLSFKLKSWYVCRYEVGPLLSDVLGAEQTVPDQLLGRVESLFSKLKKHALTHGDMKATNLIVLEDSLCLIDLDAAKSHESMRSWYKANQKDWNRLILNWPIQSPVNQTFVTLKKSVSTALG